MFSMYKLLFEAGREAREKLTNLNSLSVLHSTTQINGSSNAANSSPVSESAKGSEPKP